MKKSPFILFVFNLLICLACRGQGLSGVQSVDLSAADSTFTGKKLVLDNMRVNSATTSYSDYVRGTFKFKLATLSFTAKSFEVFPNIGIFYDGTLNDQYFANDATTPLTLTDVYGNTFDEYDDISVTTSGEPFSIYLSVNDVLSFSVSNNSDDCRLVLHAPDGSTPYSDLVGANSNIIGGTIPILQSGTYTLTITPLNNRSVSLTLAFGNANRQTLTTVQSGDYIQTDLRDGLRDYSKFQIHLNAGDRLNVDPPSSSDTHLVLVNSESVKVTDNTGLGILYISKTTENYYLFIDDRTALGTDYYGYVTVQSGANTGAIHPGAVPQAVSRQSPGKPR